MFDYVSYKKENAAKQLSTNGNQKCIRSFLFVDSVKIHFIGMGNECDILGNVSQQSDHKIKKSFEYILLN